MNLQSFSVKQDIVFGIGAVKSLPEKVRQAGGSKVLLVTDPGLIPAGITG